MKPLNLKVKIISGNKEQTEVEFNTFKENHSVFFSPAQATTINDNGTVIHYYHIFAFYQ